MDKTKQLRAKLAKDVVRELGRQGGNARAKNLSPERRRGIARKAARARWDKR